MKNYCRCKSCKNHRFFRTVETVGVDKVSSLGQRAVVLPYSNFVISPPPASVSYALEDGPEDLAAHARLLPARNCSCMVHVIFGACPNCTWGRARVLVEPSNVRFSFRDGIQCVDGHLLVGYSQAAKLLRVCIG